MEFMTVRSEMNGVSLKGADDFILSPNTGPDQGPSISAIYAKSWLKVKWPVTIIADRYNGLMSNGKWLAFPCEPSEVPDEVNGEDIEAESFWESFKGPVGKGTYPDDAMDELEYVMTQIAKGKKEE